MRSIRRFATVHPMPFVIVAPVVWMMIAGIAAYLAAVVLRLPLSHELPQSLGMLTATVCLLLVMWRWEWLHPAGITVPGSGHTGPLPASSAPWTSKRGAGVHTSVPAGLLVMSRSPSRAIDTAVLLPSTSSTCRSALRANSRTWAARRVSAGIAPSSAGAGNGPSRTSAESAPCITYSTA